MEEIVRTMPQLWRDYLFMGKELCKFVKDTESSVFKDLFTQRERLLEIIAETADKENFIKSPEGKKLIQEAVEINEELKKHLKKAQNLLTRNLEINSAYEGFFGNSLALGSRFDSET